MSTIKITKHCEAYWRVTFDIPPLNIFGLRARHPSSVCTTAVSAHRLHVAAVGHRDVCRQRFQRLTGWPRHCTYLEWLPSCRRPFREMCIRAEGQGDEVDLH